MPTRTADRVTEALRIALTAYNGLEVNSPIRALVAQRLFGVAAAVTLLPRLDDLAKAVRPQTE